MFFTRSPVLSSVSANAEFEAVVEKYRPKVFQLVYHYIGDYDEACDLTQDTFVRAFNAWSDFRGDSQVYTWLYRIALNLCHNQQKKLQRKYRTERWSLDIGAEDNEGHAPIEVADERPLPLQRIEGEEVRHRLREALLQLPDSYRTVIVLRDIEGLTYDQIAQVTNSTLEATKSRLFRARQTLRRVLEPYMRASGPEVSSEENFGARPRRHKTPKLAVPEATCILWGKALHGTR